jgi:hypothetical protein
VDYVVVENYRLLSIEMGLGEKAENAGCRNVVFQREKVRCDALQSTKRDDKDFSMFLLGGGVLTERGGSIKVQVLLFPTKKEPKARTNKGDTESMMLNWRKTANSNFNLDSRLSGSAGQIIGLEKGGWRGDNDDEEKRTAV